MGSVVEVRVTDEKIIIEVPHKGLVNEIDNVACFDSKLKRWINGGINQKRFQENFPKRWDKVKNRLEFLPIFNAASFTPEIAGMFLWDWWNSVTQKVAGNIIFRFQSKLEFNIFFKGYEELSMEKQLEFEYLLFSCLHAIKVSINGNEKQWERKNKWAPRLLPLFDYIFILISLLFSVPFVFYFTEVASNAHLPTVFDFPLFILIVFGGLIGFGYIGNILARLLWMLLLKLFISREVILLAMMYPNNLPRKAKVGTITKSLLKFSIGKDIQTT